MTRDSRRPPVPLCPVCRPMIPSAKEINDAAKKLADDGASPPVPPAEPVERDGEAEPAGYLVEERRAPSKEGPWSDWSSDVPANRVFPRARLTPEPWPENQRGPRMTRCDSDGAESWSEYRFVPLYRSRPAASIGDDYSAEPNYQDIDGNPCTLDQLCEREPAWAANRIRVMREQLRSRHAAKGKARPLWVGLCRKCAGVPDHIDDKIRDASPNACAGCGADAGVFMFQIGGSTTALPAGAVDEQGREALLTCPHCLDPMQRDVFCEKLNEYIDKTKEAEKRAETAERECERLRALAIETAESFARVIEQARADGYERGKLEAHVGGAELVERLEKLAERVEEREQDADP